MSFLIYDKLHRKFLEGKKHPHFVPEIRFPQLVSGVCHFPKGIYDRLAFEIL